MILIIKYYSFFNLMSSKHSSKPTKPIKPNKKDPSQEKNRLNNSYKTLIATFLKDAVNRHQKKQGQLNYLIKGKSNSKNKPAKKKT